ncbi:PPE family protein [Mycobacterium sp. P7213]|uniref:PPE family protein n=1 Tax=Mycobacterium sp. P7213 TaxID=2478465 RepID=UPI000F639B94|nr:PPE family protein [Mycobacterium sp. P7213]
MNYLSLPPEVTSTMIYSGPGSEPMVVAASAWSALAAELKSVAAEYRAVISQLTSEEWLGSASTSMATAAAPYINWMELTAAQAEQAAMQGRSAAAAYETAHAQTVPPVAVTANRELLQQLVATNILGQNTPSIAATEAEHGEMWAQDTLAMYGYHAQSSAATQLNEFTAPPNPTNPAGDAANANAVASAAGSATATQATKASGVLQSLANSAQSTGNPAQDVLNDPNYNLSNQLMTQLVTSSNLQSNNVCAVWRGVSGVLGLQKLFADGAKAASSGAAGAASGAASAASGAASAASGAAGAVGGLSVPAAWVPPMAAASTLGPVSGGSWVPVGPAAAAALPSAGGILGGAPIAPPTGMPGMPGIPAAGAAGAGFRGFGGPRYGTALTVMPRRPFGG